MSIFRNTVWFLKGLKEYTSSGYTSASANFNESDLQLKCEDRSYLITGMVCLSQFILLECPFANLIILAESF